MNELVPIQKLPEGESGKLIGCLSWPVIEAIASIYALPEQVRRKKIGDDNAVVNHLAGQLGVSPALVRRAKRDRRVRRLRDDLLKEAIEDLWPTLVYRLVTHALTSKDPQKSFQALAKVFGKAGESGIQVNVNSNNQTALQVNLLDGGIQEDRENLLWLKEMLETGQAQRLVDILKPVEAEIVQAPERAAG